MASGDKWFERAQELEAEAKKYKNIVKAIKKHCKALDKDLNRIFKEAEKMEDECSEYHDDVIMAEGAQNVCSQIQSIIEKGEKE